MGLRMKNVNIMEGQQFLGEGGHKETIYMGNCQKRESWQKIGRTFLREVDTWMDTDLILVHYGT